MMIAHLCGFMRLYSNDIFPMISLAAEVGREIIPDGPERFIFDGLGAEGVDGFL